jgi:tight adherence protein B
MLVVLIFLAVFLTVEGLSMLAAERRTGNRAAAKRRLRQIAMGIQDPSIQSEESILRTRRREGRSLLDLTSFLPGGFQLERRLYQAGLTITQSRFLLMSVAVGLGAWLIAAVYFVNPLAATAFLLAGFLPLMRVMQLRKKRLLLFEEQLPEALDLMTRAMRAGHSLTFGFQMVGEEMPEPIASEFGQVAEEIKLGQDLRIALGNLSYRAEAGDLPFLVTAITIQRETGGNLAEVLEKLGTLIRERFALYGKVRALTAIGRASANLLACMPFMLVLMLYTCAGKGGRGYVEPLFTTTPGLLMAAAATGLVIIGYVVCLKMAEIKV